MQNAEVVAPSVRKVPQLYSPKASDIASQLYLGYAQVIFASRVLGGEYNITETASFNITLRDNAKYRCETCLTISLNILIFDIA